MEVIDRSELHEHGTEGDFTLKTIIHQDVSQIKADNWQEAQNSNGFSDGRTMRKYASIPEVEILKAIQMGYQLDAVNPLILEIETKRYLRDYGAAAGYQTVKHIRTPGGSANIIIK